MSYDPYVAEETVAEVREHWKGPFHFGAPDGIVVNVTKDQIWVREGVLPDFPNSKAPQFDFGNGQLVVPLPPTSREKIQNQEIRDQRNLFSLQYQERFVLSSAEMEIMRLGKTQHSDGFSCHYSSMI